MSTFCTSPEPIQASPLDGFNYHFSPYLDELQPRMPYNMKYVNDLTNPLSGYPNSSDFAFRSQYQDQDQMAMPDVYDRRDSYFISDVGSEKAESRDWSVELETGDADFAVRNPKQIPGINVKGEDWGIKAFLHESANQPYSEQQRRRQTQNRNSQRSFRERKQKKFDELLVQHEELKKKYDALCEEQVQSGQTIAELKTALKEIITKI